MDSIGFAFQLHDGGAVHDAIQSLLNKRVRSAQHQENIGNSLIFQKKMA